MRNANPNTVTAFALHKTISQEFVQRLTTSIFSGWFRTASKAGEYRFLQAHENERRFRTTRIMTIVPAFGKVSHEIPGMFSPIQM
jgi:hypothetical protein